VLRFAEAAPTRFKAVPVHEAIPLLLQRMRQKTLEAQEKAAQLTERHSNRAFRVKAHEKEVKFVLISEKTALSRRIKKSIDDAQISVDVFVQGNAPSF
jgi:sugar-specific transcriptional regulator TrmB